MSPAELLALPVAVDLPTANKAFGMGDTLGYELAKAGDYPCRVLRLGRLYRVARADLLEALGLGDMREAGAATPAPALLSITPAASKLQESA
ncbi:MAG: hypothetical protein JWP11_2926 [Frankiales bacterium]|nr:hypothetical protein [Frankiales bacterium]